METRLQISKQAKTVQLGILGVGDMRFGVDIANLSEVCMCKELNAIVSARSEVIGSIELRGQLIPVLDPLALCGKKRISQKLNLVAIVENRSKMIGLAIDQTQGIIEFRQDEKQDLFSSDVSASRFVRHTIAGHGEPIYVLEAAFIFEDSDLPTCSSKTKQRLSEKRKELGAFLTFEAGGATFGLEATRIFGTVPRQKIEDAPVKGSRCIGIIRYLERKIPVVECSDAIGLGSGIVTDAPEIVVVRLDDDRLVGLAVDVIRRIKFLQKSAFCPLPEYLNHDDFLLAKIFHENDGGQVFLIDCEKITTDPDISKISDLSHSPSRLNQKRSNKELPDEPERQPCSEPARRYLVFNSGNQLAIEVKFISSIICFPDKITKINRRNIAIIGYFSHAGSPVLLIDLRVWRGLGNSTNDDHTRILVLDNNHTRVGLVVESVIGIHTAKTHYSDTDLGPLVKLQSKQLLNAIDPREILPNLTGVSRAINNQ